MDHIFDIEYNTDISLSINELIQCKKTFVDNEITFDEITNEYVIFTICDHKIKHTISTCINDILSTTEEDDIKCILSDIPNRNIFEVLNYLHANKHNLTHKIINPMLSDDEGDDMNFDNIDFGDEEFIIYSIGSIVGTILRKYPSFKIEVIEEPHAVVIKVSVPKSVFIFNLIVDTLISSRNLRIIFDEPQPDKIFLELLRKETYFNTGCNELNFDEIIMNISHALRNDIEVEIESELNIDYEITQLYNCLDIKLNDYLWKGPTKTCPVISINKASKVASLTDLTLKLSTNSVLLTELHYYKIYPIMQFYLQITNINSIINNTDEYLLLIQIMKVIMASFAFIEKCSISEVIEQYDMSDMSRINCDIIDSIKTLLSTHNAIEK
mgnify:FL=1